MSVLIDLSTIIELLGPNIEQVLWFFFGMSFGNSFGSKLDYSIQQGDWFKKQMSPLVVYLVKAVLDFTHHWWAGMILALYAYRIPVPWLVFPLTWFGWGLFFDDIRDFKNLIRRFEELKADVG